MSGDEMTRGRLVLSTIAIMTGLFLAALDQTIVGTAMPRIVAELHGLDYYAWVLTAYMVASTTSVPIAGKLGDIFGRKPFLLIGMVGFVAASALCITRYRYIGTVGIAIAATGIWLLSQVTPASSETEVVRDLILVGMGIGTTMPLYINAVQSALPPKLTGVVTSQVQFWRNIGGTIGTAILGTVLAHGLPVRIDEALAALPIPPQARAALPQGSGNAQALFDPAQIAATRAALPAAFQPVFDQVLVAIRGALAMALHDVFLYGAAVVAVGIVASLFLREVPLRGRERIVTATETEEGAPVAAFGD